MNESPCSAAPDAHPIVHKHPHGGPRGQEGLSDLPPRSRKLNIRDKGTRGPRHALTVLYNGAYQSPGKRDFNNI